MIAWARIAVTGLALTLLALALLPLQLAAIGLKHPLARRLPRVFHRAACRLIGIRVSSRGAPSAERPLLLACNHVSWADITVLGSVHDVVFVAKSEVRDWAVFGWLARLQRSVFVNRGERAGTGRQAGAVAERLAAGEAVVLFAEGTTGDGNGIRPFNSSLFGAAEAALRAGTVSCVHVQPVSIAYLGANGMPLGRFGRPLAAWTGDAGLLPHLAAFLKEGAVDVEVSFGEPVPFSADTTRKAVARMAEARVRGMLAASLANHPALGPAGPDAASGHDRRLREPLPDVI